MTLYVAVLTLILVAMFCGGVIDTCAETHASEVRANAAVLLIIAFFIGWGLVLLWLEYVQWVS